MGRSGEGRLERDFPGEAPTFKHHRDCRFRGPGLAPGICICSRFPGGSDAGHCGYAKNLCRKGSFLGQHSGFGVCGKDHGAPRGSPGVSASADPRSQRAPESQAVVPWPPPHLPAPLSATGEGRAGLAGLAGSGSELANFLLLFCIFISHLFNHLLSDLSGS